MELALGYSDAVVVYLNGRPLFLGSSAYRQRDPSFLGIVGLFDSVFLPLEPGENELVLLVAEAFGGWGFIARDADAVFTRDGVIETGSRDGFSTPESVVYDPSADVFYVSNYDAYGRTAAAGGQFISRVPRGAGEAELNWVGGLSRPTGMCLLDGRLLVVDRRGVVEIDTASGEILARSELPGARFPNDVALGPDGTVYVSDSAGNAIYRSTGDAYEVWMQGDGLASPNALLFLDGKLLVGNGGDGILTSIEPSTLATREVARMSVGPIDGIKPDGSGGLLVSQWEGRLYRVSPSGDLERLVDTTTPGTRIADFEYLPDSGTVAAPTFTDDRVVFYSLGSGY